MFSKILSLRKLSSLIKVLKKKGKKIIFTNGCFDLIHPGHIKIFKEAKKHGDVLIVGINSDRSVRKIKGNRRPLLNLKARQEVLASIALIDYIITFTQTTPLHLIKKIKPAVLVKGGDWPKKHIIGSSFIKSYGGKVVRVRLKKGYSTTRLLEKMQKK